MDPLKEYEDTAHVSLEATMYARYGHMCGLVVTDEMAARDVAEIFVALWGRARFHELHKVVPFSWARTPRTEYGDDRYHILKRVLPSLAPYRPIGHWGSNSTVIINDDKKTGLVVLHEILSPGGSEPEFNAFIELDLVKEGHRWRCLPDTIRIDEFCEKELGKFEEI